MKKLNMFNLRDAITKILYDMCGGSVSGDNLEFYVDKIMIATRNKFDQDLELFKRALSSVYSCQGPDITK